MLSEGAIPYRAAWTIEHSEGVVLVDTGMFDSTPELDEECQPVPMSENIPRDVVRIIDTHLHLGHCGGNRLFPAVPITFSGSSCKRLVTVRMG